MINKLKLNSEQIFTEKAQALKEKEALEAHSQSIETVISQACKLVP